MYIRAHLKKSYSWLNFDPIPRVADKLGIYPNQ